MCACVYVGIAIGAIAIHKYRKFNRNEGSVMYWFKTPLGHR